MLPNSIAKTKFFILSIIFIFNVSYSQKILDLHYHSVFGKEKVFQFFNDSYLSYKTKTDFFYKKNKLVNMQDSLLVFSNDSVIKLIQLKYLKIEGAKISRYPIAAGLLFFLLDTGHNIAYHNPKIISNQAIFAVSIGAIASLIIHRIEDKHVKINKNCTLRILDLDFNHLNSQ